MRRRSSRRWRAVPPGRQHHRDPSAGRRPGSRLAVAMPLPEHEPRDRLCGGRSDVAGDQVEREVVPRGRRPRGDQPPVVTGDHENLLESQHHVGVSLAEVRSPTSSGSSRRCRRAGPSPPSGSRPVHAEQIVAPPSYISCSQRTSFGYRPGDPIALASNVHRGHDHDVGLRHLVHRSVRGDDKPAGALDHACGLGHDLDVERVRLARVPILGRDEAAPPTSESRTSRSPGRQLESGVATMLIRVG